MRYSGTRVDVALFVSEALKNLKTGSQLTTVIERVKSEVYFVTYATNTLSEGTGRKTRRYLKQRILTSRRTTRDG